MWLKSHRWVNHPHTVTERRREMNVRESTHTAMLFDRRYQNIDTGKFDTDKLHTLNNLSLVDLMDEGDSSNWINTYVRQDKRDREQPENNVYNFPKHIPKDNGFDEEIRRENERKRLIAKQEQRRIEIEEERKRREEEFIKQRQYYEEQKRKSKEQETSYAKQIAEIEARLLQESYDRNQRIRENNYLRHAGNVRPNVWRHK